MSSCDLSNNEQAEPNTSKFSIVMTATDHRFEQVFEQLQWYGGTEVVHCNNDSVIFDARRNGDFAIGSTVGNCICD
ncbi:hypothetical protein D3C85_1478900 [compost metagenome]